MPPVEFKKRPCHPVEFKGQWPHQAPQCRYRPYTMLSGRWERKGPGGDVGDGLILIELLVMVIMVDIQTHNVYVPAGKAAPPRCPCPLGFQTWIIKVDYHIM